MGELLPLSYGTVAPPALLAGGVIFVVASERPYERWNPQPVNPAGSKVSVKSDFVHNLFDAARIKTGKASYLLEEVVPRLDQ